MDSQFPLQFTALALFAVVALALFVIGTRFARRTAPATIPGKRRKTMMPLAEAAAAVYQAARREKMVIATVAEKAPLGPEAWFAQSIAGVVPVYRAGGSSAFEKLEKADIGTAPEALYIQRQDYQTYVRWARSMR